VDSISSSTVCVYTVPTDAPEADGTISWNSTTMVLVELVVGEVRGIGYTYADAATAKVAQHLLQTVLHSAHPWQHAALWMQMQRSVRNLGNRGIAAMAISAIDIALWDLRAKLLHVSLVQLLGTARDSIPAYGRGGFTSYDDRQLQSQLGEWAEKGFLFVKMKVGTDPADDPRRVLPVFMCTPVALFPARVIWSSSTITLALSGCFSMDFASRVKAKCFPTSLAPGWGWN
jgi:L-alanine-DL-glutamate epimerase-like enolase superfamily enzyme